MAHPVVAVAREVLGRELPVAGHQPLVDAADHLGAALASVPRVEEQVEVELVAAEVVQEGGGRGIPGRPDRALVALQAGHLDEPPSGPVEIVSVRAPRERHPHERAVRAIAPAVVWTHELDGIPLVVAADLHPAVPARVEEDVDPLRAVPADDDRLLAHRGREVVAGARDLALVAQEQPRAGEDPLQLLPVDLVVHKDLAAHAALLDVDQAAEPLAADVTHHPLLRARSSRAPFDRPATLARDGKAELPAPQAVLPIAAARCTISRTVHPTGAEPCRSPTSAESSCSTRRRDKARPC